MIENHKKITLVLVMGLTGLFLAGLYINIKNQEVKRPRKVWVFPTAAPTPVVPTNYPTPTQIPTPTEKPTVDNFGLTAPKLYPDLSWTQTSQKTLDKIAWRDMPAGSFGEITMPGTEWIAKYTVNNKAELEMIDKPRIYMLDLLLNKMLWEGNYMFDINNITFVIQDAAGPGGIISSAHKIVNDKVRVVTNSERIPKSAFGGNPSLFNYPFDIEFRVFVSDIMPISSLLSQVKSN